MSHQLFSSQRVMMPEGERPACVVVRAGRIVDILPYDGPRPPADQQHDFGDRVLMPGLVDSHVHINEPGRTDWEGFDTATHAAAAGGITSLVDMPLNCIPVTISAAAFAAKQAVLAGKLWVDAGFWGGATADNLAELPALLAAGVLGVKSFTIDSGIDEFQSVNEAQLTLAMRQLARRDLPHLIHAELDHSPAEPMSTPTSYQGFLSSRPARWENDAVALVIRVMRQLVSEGLTPRAHIVHLSSAQALPMIRAARAEGLLLSCETCPHYLVLAAETIPDGQASYKCCPPIREQSNQESLWQGLLDGSIDCIVSDHSPCTPNLKNLDSGDIENAWGGISGLQFGLSLIWTAARQRGMPLTDLVRLMAQRPAELCGLTDKGAIAIGQQADFCVFAPEQSFTVSAEIIQHRHKVSPYLGHQLTGVVRSTWLAGELIYSNEDRPHFPGPARGRALLAEQESN